MSGVGRFGLVLAVLAAALAASFFIAQWWSPVCHEGCPGAIQGAMWLFLLAMPLGLAGVVGVAAGRPRALARIGLALVVLAVLGGVLTAVAVWFPGFAHGG